MTNGVATKYYYLGGQRVALNKGGTLAYLHNDHLGGTNTVTDASGNCTGQQAYYPYGTIRTIAPNPPCTTTIPTDVGFTGQRLDASSGLMFYNARYYDPTIGRFISADTVVPNLFNPQHLNRYTYVYNNPVKYTDPSGHEPPWDDFWTWAQQSFQTLITLLQQPLRQAYDSACGNTISDACGVHPKAPSISDALKSVQKSADRPTFGDPVNPEVSKSLDRVYDAAGRLVPLGFRNADEFAEFGTELKGGLESAGYDDVQAAFQGSSVTGVKYTTGKEFDVGRVSDYDIALGSPSLLERAKELGIGLRSGGTRTGPLSDQELKMLGLYDLKLELSRRAGREVNFMIFESLEDATERVPSIVVQ